MTPKLMHSCSWRFRWGGAPRDCGVNSKRGPHELGKIKGPWRRRRMHGLIGRLLHAGVFAFQAFRRLIWFFTEPDLVGVHGIPLTPEGKIVLVMLSYASGWRLPGGGVKTAEDRRTAMLRELREEIGLRDYKSIYRVTGSDHRPDQRQEKDTLFVIRGVLYKPRWSLEVKQVCEFSLDDLPDSTAEITRQLLALAAPSLSLTRG